MYSDTLRRATLIACLGIVLAALPALAFEPTVTVVQGAPGDVLSVSDISARGARFAVTTDASIAGEQMAMLAWSGDGGLTWDSIPLDDVGTRESQATVCAGYAVMVFTSANVLPPTTWSAHTLAVPVGGGALVEKGWTSTGVVRDPDIACVANERVVTAWFKQMSSGYTVRVRTGAHDDEDSTAGQSFDLGKGTRSRGLAIASTSNRVYVTWFRGGSLQLHRFSIGSAPGHALTSLGTRTIATVPDGDLPQIGADGDRVVIAYQDYASVKVRRSTDRGVGFGGPKTLLDEGDSGDVFAYPTTVAVRGGQVVVGGSEVGIEGSGGGFGFLSTNGGSSYARVSTRVSGVVVATLLTVGSSVRYAEAWDQGISYPPVQRVRFRRQ